jgi:hypothetical protein
MGYKGFIIKCLSIIALAAVPFAADGLHPAAAKHVKGLQGHQMNTLMADMRVQPLASIDLPDFSLPDIQNKSFNIKDFAGKVLFINFWTTF